MKIFVIVIAATLLTVMDRLLEINIPFWVQIPHKIGYMVFGIMIHSMRKD